MIVIKDARLFYFAALMALSFSGESVAQGTGDVTSITVSSSSSNSQSNVPLTFGHVFEQGTVTDFDTIGLRLPDGTELPVQLDSKSSHADGSLSHGVISVVVPSLPGNAELPLTLHTAGNSASGPSVSISDLLSSSFDATVALDVGGTQYTASARDLLENTTPTTWLAGPIASEWLVSGALETSSGSQHPHLAARFHIRAYDGIETVRVSVIVENNWSFVSGPQNYSYDASVTVPGKGVVLTQNNVNHYRQARWRRVFWWGTEPAADVSHDTLYMQSIGVVPTYDDRINISEGTLQSMANEWSGSKTQLMGPGLIYTYMPEGGGRPDIAPLPRWTARYLMTRDARAKVSVLGTSEQAGSFGIHYRDQDTDLPTSLDTYPGMTVLGNGGVFPGCGGSCNTPYTPDVAHQPSTSYVPYLITGDYFHLEELQFWANWNMFYWGDHGGSQGLMVNDQIRAQAWGLRTLGHAAFATPDDHPLKAYFLAKLNNNLAWYDNNVTSSPPTPLGYLLNPSGLGLNNTFATWMDDFFTWTVGHLVTLGFESAREIFDYKAAFPVGRMTDPDYCWILAATYWTRSRDAQSGQPFDNWADYKEAVIRAWDSNSVGPSFGYGPEAFPPNMSGAQEDALIAAQCNSPTMAGILGLQQGDMIGISWSHEGYPSNMQPAVAMVAEMGVVNGGLAWSLFDSRTVVPDDPPYAYSVSPQWAVVPRNGDPVDPGPGPLPTVSLTANPWTVMSGDDSMLSWAAANADACTASGGWDGARPVSGTEMTGSLTVDTTYNLECSNSEGNASASATVTVTEPGPTPEAPTVNFSADPTSVSEGGSVTLTWTASNADSCSASGSWSGVKALTGSESVDPTSGASSYTLTCTGSGGSTTEMLNITVTPVVVDPPPVDPPPDANRSEGGTGSFGLLALFACLMAVIRRYAPDARTSVRSAAAACRKALGMTIAAAIALASLSACKSTEERVADTVLETFPPTVSLSASSGAVTSGDTVTLTWSAANADDCSATGAWDGVKSTSGSEDVGPLTVDSQFVLTCTGAGGSTDDTVNVSVSATPPPNPAPTLSFFATPATVTSGNPATLTWQATNADSCTASGDWSGPQATSGSESTGDLTGDAVYQLMCSGPGGDVSASTSVDVIPATSAGLVGSVDSSLINRNGINTVYIYAGTGVTPDDIDGDSGDPLFSQVVTQDVGACTFGYENAAVPPGDYTVAYTSDAMADDPLQDDNIQFTGTTNVSVPASGERVDFDAQSIIRVGPGRAIQTVAGAANVANDGDVIEVDAGLYAGDVAVWYQDDITIRGVGGYAHLRADGANVQGKGIWVIAGNDVVVENIEFSEVTVPDQNGAGIRHDGWNLVVCNGYFHDSEEGILGGAGDVLVEYSEFDNNGYGDGYSHNMYILDAEKFTLRYSYTHHAIIGHNVKTRAKENHILYNRIMDESDGTASYAVDIPNGGLSFVVGNLMQQGPDTDNYAIVNYGTEGLLGGRTHNLYLVNNTIVDDRGNGVFVQAASGTSQIELVNNLLVGSGTVVSGASANMTTNLQTTGPGLVDIDNYDYRLAAGSPAIDAGSQPGVADGFDLNPDLQYLHPSSRESRPVNGQMDIGAYEFE